MKLNFPQSSSVLRTPSPKEKDATTKILKVTFCAMSLFFALPIFSQTKTELQTQVDKQKKSIDSLHLVIANLDNTIENRDRTVKFCYDEKVELNKTIDELNGKIRGKNSELLQLRENAAFGTVKKITLNNTRGAFVVPEGKYWVINQFIGDYITDLAADSSGNFVGNEIYVFLKTINKETLTDISQNKYGPLLYSSMTPNQTMQFPLVLTTGTSFSVIIYKGKMGSLVEYAGDVVCTYFEKTN